MTRREILIEAFKRAGFDTHRILDDERGNPCGGIDCYECPFHGSGDDLCVNRFRSWINEDVPNDPVTVQNVNAKWITISGEHYKADEIGRFEWSEKSGGSLWIWRDPFQVDAAFVAFEDPYKKLYHSLCAQLGVEPVGDDE